jgi:feruloyl-CoA synthase
VRDAARVSPRFAPAAVNRSERPDGTVVLSSPLPLGEYPSSLGAHLVRWAKEAPDRAFLLERRDESWTGVTYSEALARVRSIAQWLLDGGLNAMTPLLLLSDNSVAHALVQLAAMHVGIPAAPISPAYSLMSKDFAKLKLVVEALGAGAVFYADDPRFEPALARLPALPRVAFDATPTSAVDDGLREGHA